MLNIDNYNFKGKKALIRVDFNVPVKEGVITDDTRMRAALPTIKKVLNDGGSAIIMSHFGRPKEGPEEKYSLKQLVPHLKELLGSEVKFCPNCIDAEAIVMSHALNSGETLMLENTRFYPEETQGDKVFAEELAHLGDVYINDAFGTAHREHASTATIAQFMRNGQKMFGYLMQKEVEAANKIMKNAETPLTAIIGGAKVSDKILIIENLLNIADKVIIGGGMAYTFFKALGGSIGSSLCEDDKLDLAKELIKKADKKGVELLLPEDSIIADKFADDANTKVCNSMKIGNNWMGLDIGPAAIKRYEEAIFSSKTILWNGPMGVFEMKSFSKGTEAVARAVAKATQQGAFSLIGGGDSVAAINKFHLENEVSYVSTGGGAMLEYFEGKTLPGIQAVLD